MGLFGKRASDLKPFGQEAFLNQLKRFCSPRRIIGAVFCAAGAVLLVASLAGALGSSPPPDGPPPQAATSIPDTQTTSGTAEPSIATEQNEISDQPKASKPSPLNTQTDTPKTQGATAESPPKPDPNTFTVSLKINNQPAASVTVPLGSNQCDVLTRALEQGVIQSLNMRWDEDKQTYGVYQINGVGDPNKVTWVYEVNRTSPFKGCSHITANANDTIHWKHLN